jgi:hypothetical protein
MGEPPSSSPSALAPARASRRSHLALELVIVTLGVLIALLLENAATWLHNRSLAQEARNNIQAEIRESQRRVAEFLELAEKWSQERKVMRQLIDDLIAKRPVKSADLNLNLTLTGLTSAAWQTAGATGALGHMPYSEVRGYAQLYGVQAQFESLQSDYLREFGQLTMHGMDPEQMTADELQGMKERLGRVEASIRTQQGLARILQRIYPSFLHEQKTPLVGVAATRP